MGHSKNTHSNFTVKTLQSTLIRDQKGRKIVARSYTFVLTKYIISLLAYSKQQQQPQQQQKKNNK